MLDYRPPPSTSSWTTSDLSPTQPHPQPPPTVFNFLSLAPHLASSKSLIKLLIEQAADLTHAAQSKSESSDSSTNAAAEGASGGDTDTGARTRYIRETSRHKINLLADIVAEFTTYHGLERYQEGLGGVGRSGGAEQSADRGGQGTGGVSFWETCPALEILEELERRRPGGRWRGGLGR